MDEDELTAIDRLGETKANVTAELADIEAKRTATAQKAVDALDRELRRDRFVANMIVAGALIVGVAIVVGILLLGYFGAR